MSMCKKFVKKYWKWFILDGIIFFILSIGLVWLGFDIFLILLSITFLGFIKDSYDYYLIKQGKDSFCHAYVEHFPLMLYILFYGIISFLFLENSLAWAALIFLSSTEAFIDYTQDKWCKCKC